MKRILAFLLTTITIFSCISFAFLANGANYNAKDYLTNKVWTKCVVNESGSGKYTVTRNFDSDGNITKTNTHYGSDYSYGETGDITSIYKYDSSNRLIKKSYEGFYDESTTTYSYNSSGNVSKIVDDYRYKSEYYYTTTKFSYNSKGLLTSKTENIKSIWHNEPAEYSTEKTSYSYTSDKYISKIVVKDSYNSPQISYTYNSKKQLTKIVGKISTGNVTTTKFEYDDKGNLIFKSINEKGDEYSSGSSKYYYYSYDKYGRLKTYDDNDSSITYTYNSNNDVIKKEIYSYYSGYSTVTYSYTYKTLNKKIVSTPDGVFLNHSSYTYDGKAKKPNVSIYNNVCDVSELYRYENGNDYYIIYSNNVNPGTAKATIVFLETNSYSLGYVNPPITVTYTIKSADTSSGSTKYKTTTKLNMRASASSGSKLVTSVPSGATVTYLNKKSGDYSYVSYTKSGKTYKGWVLTKYLKAVTSAIKYKTTAKLNMRASASSGSKLVTSVPSGTTVTYLNKKSGDYSYVSYTKSGKTYKGWVLTKYLKKV